MKNLIILSDLSNDEVYKIVRDNLLLCQVPNKPILEQDQIYHHNTNYQKTANIIKYGILTLHNKRILDGLPLSHDEIKKYNEDYHVNGTDSVSLTNSNIKEEDLYRNEDYHGHTSSSDVDICILKKIETEIFIYRETTNYGDEYLAKGDILPTFFSTLDLRIFNHLNQKNNETELLKIINNYNCLMEIAHAMILTNATFPIREVSEKEITLNPYEISKLPKILVKK